MLDKQSPIPIYFQIEENIKQLIKSGDIKPFEAIPSEREYSELFEVSRMTVRQAINNLVSAGYLYRQKGKGTFVAERKFVQTLQELTSFTEDMKGRGLEPGSKLIMFDIISASEEIASKLRLKTNDLIYKIQRIRLANNQPIAFETTYLSHQLIKDLNEDIVNHSSLYHYIENDLHLTIHHATQTIEASIASDDEINYLEIPKGSPTLLIERHSYSTNGQPIELVKSAYRSDRYKFIIDMKREK